MPVLEIRKEGDPVLRAKAKPVRHVNATVRQLIDDMVRTMRAARGAGLAAPQVGVSRRVIVVETDEALYELVNPEIISRDGTETAIEGCLSVPGIVGEVERAAKVRVRGLDRDGRTTWVDGEGLLARVLQHEIDHLEGVLFVDKASATYESRPEPEVRPMRVVFMGTPEFAVPSLLAVLRDTHEIVGVVTRPDRPRGRGMVVAPSPVKVAAARHRLLLVQPPSCRSPEFVEWLRGVKPDVVVVVAFGQILPKEVLDVPPLGCINVHASLLPKYRGAAPVNWAIINGERMTGVTTMYMCERLDAGDIILAREVPILPDEDAGSLHDRLMEEGADLLTETLRLVAAGKAPRTPQDDSLATYAPSLAREHEVIDWGRPAERIRNQVRGLSPHPGAHTVRGGRLLKVLAAAVVDAPPHGGGARPGLVLVADQEAGFVVLTGDGALRIDSVQPEGGKRMSATDYLRGARVVPGEVLGV